MVTGASTANLAIVLIDARKGVIEQTCRHAFIANLLRIQHVVIAINKMDLVEYKEEVFKEITAAFKQFASRLENLVEMTFIPISALKATTWSINPPTCPGTKGRPCCIIWRRFTSARMPTMSSAFSCAVRHSSAFGQVPRLSRIRRACGRRGVPARR